MAIPGRGESNEFDDDQNLLPLGSMFVLSATVSRPLPKGFDVFFQGENLTNTEYNIGRDAGGDDRAADPGAGRPALAEPAISPHEIRGTAILPVANSIL